MKTQKEKQNMCGEKARELEKLIGAQYSNTAGIVVRKNGETVYEAYFNGCTATSKIHIYSVTKSIVSLLIGIAIGKGYIEGIEQKVFRFFPAYSPKRSDRIFQDIALKNLLTMTAPYQYETAPYVAYFTGNDNVKFSLDLLGGQGKIGEFRYTPLIGPDILSGILVKATGQPVLRFATENLFSPLGIAVSGPVVFHSEEEQRAFNSSTTISGWVADGAGVNTAGWGLTLSPLDMAKIGQLCLNGGTWDGMPVVPASWIDQSTKEHSRWQEPDLPYGFLWWIVDEKERAYAAMGDGGNVIYVNTKKNLVVSIASLFVPDAKDRLEFIKKYVEPIFEG